MGPWTKCLFSRIHKVTCFLSLNYHPNAVIQLSLQRQLGLPAFVLSSWSNYAPVTCSRHINTNLLAYAVMVLSFNRTHISSSWYIIVTFKICYIITIIYHTSSIWTDARVCLHYWVAIWVAGYCNPPPPTHPPVYCTGFGVCHGQDRYGVNVVFCFRHLLPPIITIMQECSQACKLVNACRVYLVEVYLTCC